METSVNEKGFFSDRIERLRSDLVGEVPRPDNERLKFLMDVYQETDGQSPVLRRAKLFDRLCSEKSIFIDDNPLVGTLTRHKLGGYLFPEYNCRWMRKMASVPTHMGDVGLAETDEDAELINRTVDYWSDRCQQARATEVITRSLGIDHKLIANCGIWSNQTIDVSMITLADYGMALDKGYKGIIAMVEEEMEKLDTGDPDGLQKWDFYNAEIIVLNAIIKLARRYASLAGEMAEKERTPERKKELERISKTCEWVPANPPRDFYEALQTVWFTQLGIWIENPVVNAPSGRFDQYMHPFYMKDKKDGKLTDEEVIELLELWYIKQQGLANIIYSPRAWKVNSPSLRMHLSLAGYTPEGQDATNELSYLVLEAKRRTSTPEPHLLVFYHDKISEEFLSKCTEVIRTGIGQPAFFNADVSLKRNLYNLVRKDGTRITIEEARNNAVLGCVQNLVSGYAHGYWEGLFNVAKMLELALNNGKDPMKGIQVGTETGSAESFRSYEELCEAVKEQTRYFMLLQRKCTRISWNAFRDFPVPFGSTFVHDCIEEGKDQLDNGARYTSQSGLIFITTIDLVNSLAAIKKLVFEEKKITMKQLNEALAANFEGDGHGEIQRMCIDAPKHGNDDEYVDSITREWFAFLESEHRKYNKDFQDRSLLPEAFSLQEHADRGELTGALPSGRKAKIALTDASVSAFPGTDINGPTALVNSAAQAMDTIKWGSNHFNMKFHPSALEGRGGAMKLMALIKTYMNLDGYHIQFNCVNAETLKEAQLSPEEYRDLVVRVAGFSAYFVYLDKTTQDELIRRTEHKFA